jgi:hypothetical protein
LVTLSEWLPEGRSSLLVKGVPVTAEDPDDEVIVGEELF